MSSQQITLPNGVKYEQPIGAFINNEYVTPSGDKFKVFDPRYVRYPIPFSNDVTDCVASAPTN